MKRPFLWVGIAFLCGALCPLLFSSAAGCVLAAAGSLASLALLAFRRSWAWRGLVLFAVLLAGIASGEHYLKQEENARAWFLNRQELTGTVSQAGGQSFRLKVEPPGGGSFYCQVFWEGGGMPEPGQELTVRGTITELSSASNPGQFDWKAYGRNLGLLAQCNADEIFLRRSAPLLYRWSSRLREQIVVRAKALFSEETAGLVIAMLTGRKEELPEGVYETMQELGGAHVLAVSGMHVAILSGCIVFFLRRVLRKKYAYGVGFCFLFFFGMLTGFPISCVRALGGYMFLAVGRLLGKRADPVTSLTVILVVCVLLRPVQLLDFGTRLSFGAAFSLAVFVPAFRETETKKRFWETAKTTCLLQLSLLPVLLSHSYRFSPYSIVVNCLLLFGVSSFFLFSLFVLILSAFLSGAAVLLAAFADLSVRFFLNFCYGTLRLPFSVVVTGKPELWGVLLFYAVLTVTAVRNRKKGVHPLRGGILLLSIGLLFHCQDEKAIAFLDVGQGDCAVVLYEDVVCVIDCGSSGTAMAGSEVLLPFLRYYGHAGIDLAVVSHLDADHVNGLEQLLAVGISVEQILLSDYGDGSARAWITENGFSGVWHFPKAGEAYGMKKLRLSILFPEETPETSQNETSLTVLLEFGEVRALFPGDLGAEQLLAAAREAGGVTLLKVPHHGSRFSVSEEALALLEPETGVVSCGRGNLYGHPHDETLAVYERLGIRLHRTDTDGCFIYFFENEKINVKK